MYAQKTKLHERQRRHRPGRLRTIALDVTSKCNMACPHCYADTFRDEDQLDLDVLGRTLEEFYELGVFHYVFQGGEPIVSPARLEAILKMAHPEETYFNVVSNGWAMTPDRIAWLKSLQVDKIAFSLDSGLEHEHDAGRGQGSFKRVIKAIDDVLAAGLLASISVVVTRNSLYSEGFRLAYEFARKKKIRIDVQIAEPVGRWDGRKELLMRPEDTAYIKSLERQSPVLPNGQTMVHRDIYGPNRDYCPAGTEFMALTAGGLLLPCNFLQFSLGNVKERSVREMREELLTSPWFDDSHPICLIGEDEEFIDSFVMPFVDRAKPLSAHEIFGLRGGNGR